MTPELLLQARSSSWFGTVSRVDRDVDDEPLFWVQGYLIRESIWGKCGIEVPIFALVAEFYVAANLLQTKGVYEYISGSQQSIKVKLKKANQDVAFRVWHDEFKFAETFAFDVNINRLAVFLRNAEFLRLAPRETVSAIDRFAFVKQ